MNQQFHRWAEWLLTFALAVLSNTFGILRVACALPSGLTMDGVGYGVRAVNIFRHFSLPRSW